MEVDPPIAPNNSISIHGHNGSNKFSHTSFGSRDLESFSNATSTLMSGGLKRSNSAPMINALVSSASLEISPPSSYIAIDNGRTRRSSSSSTTLHSSATPVKIPDRINQLKQEEIHIVDRETKREREVRSTIQLTHSLDEFSVDDHERMVCEVATRRPRSFSETLHIFTSPCILAGAPSPTRVGKQCFSPSMQAAVKNHSFTPSPSPSPTRKTFVRSLSPIINMRPGHVLGKRKLDCDGDSYMSPPKKFQAGPTTPDRMIPHPLAHSSVSSSSLENSSPEQMVPRVAGVHDIHIPIGSRPAPHMFGFRPLGTSQDMQTTDSENSDITESTDMSESGDSSLALLQSMSASPTSAVFTPGKRADL